jgi:hypothetical protein
MEFLFDAGRFAFSDFTGFILNDTADGLRLAWHFPFTTLTVEAGWFGFVIKPNTTVLLSQSDAVDSVTEDVYYAPRRLFETLSLQVPEAFLSHDLRLAWMAQQDLRRSGDFAEPGDRVNTFYAGAGLEGSFFPGVFHDVFAFGGFGSISGDRQIFSGFFGGGVRYYRKDAVSSRYDLRILRATGEPGAGRFYSPPGGGSRQFLPISRKDTGIVFSPRMGNMTLCEIGWSGKPRDPLFVDLRGFAFWRSAAGPISESGIDQEDDRDLFLGLELDARAGWRFHSDFGASAGLGCFLPAAGSLGAFHDDSVRFTMTVEATFAF